jgi:hypothetical protein
LLGSGFGVRRSWYGFNWDDARKNFDGKLWIESRWSGSYGIIGNEKVGKTEFGAKIAIKRCALALQMT